MKGHITQEMFKDGVEHAYNKGWNEAIEEALKLCARINRNTTAMSELYKEIQKLKK